MITCNENAPRDEGQPRHDDRLARLGKQPDGKHAHRIAYPPHARPPVPGCGASGLWRGRPRGGAGPAPPEPAATLASPAIARMRMGELAGSQAPQGPGGHAVNDDMERSSNGRPG